VSVVTVNETRNRGIGVRFPVDADTVLFCTALRLLLESSQSPMKWEKGALFPGVKRPGREATDIRCGG
jgi:hypothetical protein